MQHIFHTNTSFEPRTQITHDGYETTITSPPTVWEKDMWNRCKEERGESHVGDKMTLSDIVKVLGKPSFNREGHSDQMFGEDCYLLTEYRALMHRIRQGLQRSAMWPTGEYAVYSEILLPGALAMGDFREALSRKIKHTLEAEGVEYTASGDRDNLRITVSAKLQ